MKRLKILIVMFFVMFCTVNSTANSENTQQESTVKKEIVHNGWTATYYGGTYKTARRTADGSIFNKNAMTCAAPKTYKFGTMLKVTNVKNGKSVVVKVTDRGGFGHRNIDLTHGAFGKIANHSCGRIKVNVEVVS